jgi:hypothetical protein
VVITWENHESGMGNVFGQVLTGAQVDEEVAFPMQDESWTGDRRKNLAHIQL